MTISGENIGDRRGLNRDGTNNGRDSNDDNSDGDDRAGAGSSSRQTAPGLRRWKLELSIPWESKREAPTQRGPVRDIVS